ncbi:hypothetical protein AAVH_08682 [Aphelenchoides avenae]|nr:hypothetical protein AAVH_08682 [Aphelenchus avenae]
MDALQKAAADLASAGRKLSAHVKKHDDATRSYREAHKEFDAAEKKYAEATRAYAQNVRKKATLRLTTSSVDKNNRSSRKRRASSADTYGASD